MPDDDPGGDPLLPNIVRVGPNGAFTKRVSCAVWRLAREGETGVPANVM